MCVCKNYACCVMLAACIVSLARVCYLSTDVSVLTLNEYIHRSSSRDTTTRTTEEINEDSFVASV